MNRPHIVLFPFPGSGRLHPFMVLANRLALSGCIVSFIVPEDRLLQATKAYKSKAECNPHVLLHAIKGKDTTDLQVRVQDSANSITSAIQNFLNESLSSQVENLLIEISHRYTKPLFIVSCEIALPTSVKVAKKLAIPQCVFMPMPAALLCVMCHVRNLEMQGSLPLETTEDLQVPGFESFPGKEEQSGFVVGLFLKGKNEIMKQFNLHDCYYESSMLLHECSALLVNSFEEIEEQAITALRSPQLNPNSLPVFPVGPLVSNACFFSSHYAGEYDSDDVEVLAFLDKQAHGTVVYICFGSIVVPSNEQVMEIAQGLESSGKRFLWVMNVEHPHEILPEGFVSRTHDVGMVTNRWVSQTRVLLHPAIGVFLTHCGWNSTIESVSLGVPVIGMPSFADQFTSCWILTEKLKMGIKLKLPITGEKVVESVNVLMDSEEGEEIRRNASKARGLAGEAFRRSELSLQQLLSKYM